MEGYTQLKDINIMGVSVKDKSFTSEFVKFTLQILCTA